MRHYHPGARRGLDVHVPRVPTANPNESQSRRRLERLGRHEIRLDEQCYYPFGGQLLSQFVGIHQRQRLRPRPGLNVRDFCQALRLISVQLYQAQHARPAGR